MARAILAIDQGTTNTKVLLVDEHSKLLRRVSLPVPVEVPRPGWVQQDAGVLWQIVQEAIYRALDTTPGTRLAAVAITNQRESIIAWDRHSGEPLGPCISWRCKRTVPICEALRQQGWAERVTSRTGLPLDASFSASKARWLLDHIPDGQRRAEAGDLCLGTVDSWLLWKLTAGAVHATDVSNASRTLLFDIHRCQWDEMLLDLFGIPKAALPEVRLSSGWFGETDRCGLMPGGVGIAAMVGDSHAALFGHGLFAPGGVKATYGTGSSVMGRVDVPPARPGGLSVTIAWGLAGRVYYAVEGNILSAGEAVRWVGSLLGLEGEVCRLVELASSVEDSAGVYFVPALTGLGAPYWDERAQGILCGLSEVTTRAHVARAAIEAIAFQVAEVFHALEPVLDVPCALLRADGGASQNDWLMQFQADILGRPVMRSRNPEMSALGAAWLAGLALGWWSLEELSGYATLTDVFEPKMSEAARQERWRGWRLAVERARLRGPKS